MATVTLSMTVGTDTYSASADIADADAGKIIAAYSGPFNAGLPEGAPPLTPQEVFSAVAGQMMGEVVAFTQQYEHNQALAAVTVPSPITVTPQP
jgi:hypothetical protein